MIVYLVLIVLLLASAVYDVAALRIPNVLCAAIAILFLVPTAASFWVGGTVNLALEHVGAGVLMFLIGWGLFVIGVMGGGDVKLLAATSIWVGFDLLLHHVVYIALLGLVVLVVLFSARFLAKIFMARLRIPQGRRFPVSLKPEEGVPYGVAISAAAIILLERLPETFWPI